jgi:acyl-coenzyme A thioesterase PaaI-like protein
MATVSLSRPVHAYPHRGCFVCGAENPRGLQLTFASDAKGVMTARWTPGAEWEGFRGIVHGGVVSTVLDEAMSKAVAASGLEALTAELRVRFRAPVRSGEEYVVRGWMSRRSKRLLETEAILASPDRGECAHAWARFLALPGGQ